MTSELMSCWPDRLRELIGDATVTPHYVLNKSRKTYVVRTGTGERFYLKVTTCGADLVQDVPRIRWTRDVAGLTAPEVVDAGFTRDMSWLLTMELPGRDFLASLNSGAPIESTIRKFSVALRNVHRIPTTTCPFHWTMESVVTSLETRIAAGEIHSLHRQRPEHQHYTLPDVLDILQRTCPSDLATSPVVIHGDYTLRNVMLSPTDTVSYVDLGRIGTGDRWMDLAFGFQSVLDAAGEEYSDVFLDSYGIEMDRDRLEFFSLLVDFAY